MPIFDLHVHTVVGSSDSGLKPTDLIREAKRIGLDGVILTEHGGGWDKFTFERFARGNDIVLLRGLEVETDMGHILVLGLDGYSAGIGNVRELRKVVDRVGGVMISAHPFRNIFNKPPHNLNLVFRDSNELPRNSKEAANHPLFELVDDIEVVNGATADRENRFALEVSRHLEFKGTGGSDAHSVHGLGSCVTIFEGEIRSETDLIEAIKAKAFRPGEGFNTGQLKHFGEESGR